METSAATWPILGHTVLVQTFRRLLARSTLPDAMLLHGPDGVGKRTVGMLLHQSLHCRAGGQGETSPCGQCVPCKQFLRGAHPDALVIGPTEDLGVIGIDRVRSVHRFLMLQPGLGAVRSVLMDEADQLTEEAANALLKLLEEPPPSTSVVLVTSRPDLLPETVRSRCATFRFAPVPPNELFEALRRRGCAEARAHDLTQFAFGSPGAVLPFLDDPEQFTRVRADLAAIAAVLASPLPDRLRATSQWLRGSVRARAVKDAAGLLEAIQWMLRDALVLHRQGHAFVRFRFLREQLLLLLRSASVETLLRASRHVDESLRALRANAQPQLLLEHVLLHL